MGLPSKYAIACYWAKTDASVCMDSGEPACFACGYYLERWDRPKSEAKRWERCPLERAHIIGEAQGGGTEVSNFVNLCTRCHPEAPMTTRPGDMLNWVRARESYYAYKARVLQKEFEALGLFDQMTGLTEDQIEQVRRHIVGGADPTYGRHFGTGISDSTFALAWRDAMKDLGLLDDEQDQGTLKDGPSAEGV